MTVLLVVTIACGLTALAFGTHAVRLALIGCLVIAAFSFLMAAMGKHRTLGGQLWGVVGLSVPCVPMLLASGTSVAYSFTVWACWLLAFSATSIAVRSVIAAQKRQSRVIHVCIIAAISLVIGIASMRGVYWPLVTLPMIGLSWYMLASPPPARHLKRVGWTLVLGTLATAWLVVQHLPA